MNTDKNSLRSSRLSSVFICVHLWLISFCFSAPARAETHEFAFDASSLNPKPKSMHVAGSFNGWSKSATPMKRDAKDVWRATVDLPQGTHYYKFVADDDRWLPDPKADHDLDQDDNYGGKNSGIVIGPNIKKAPPPKPDHVNLDLVRHDPVDTSDLDVA